MSEFKGTKGEWRIVRYKNHFEIETFGTDNWIISKTITNYEQDEDNVKLSVCAPEMLEILDKIITGYENAGGEMWIPDMIQEHIFTAKKIIKKATE